MHTVHSSLSTHPALVSRITVKRLGASIVRGRGGGDLGVRLWEGEVKCPRAREDDSRDSGN